MRDLSRATGMSLAGMYHYFGSKERLLYLIQKHTFTEILDRLRERLENVSNAEHGIRTFILNHLEYFLERQQAMKVLSHEDEALEGNYGSQIAEIKRASPTAGMLETEFDPAGRAHSYMRGGAAAISVLTEERRFLGRLGDLTAVRGALALSGGSFSGPAERVPMPALLATAAEHPHLIRQRLRTHT